MSRQELESRFVDEINIMNIPNHQKRRLIAIFIEALDYKPAPKKRAKS